MYNQSNENEKLPISVIPLHGRSQKEEKSIQKGTLSPRQRRLHGVKKVAFRFQQWPDEAGKNDGELN